MTFDINKYSFQASITINGVPLPESPLFKSHVIIRDEPADTVIYHEGAQPRGVYIVKRGKIKISQSGKDGKEQIIYIYRRGELFGYRPLLCEQPHPVTATTLEECSIAFIHRNHFMDALSKSHELAKALLSQLSHEFIVWVNKINVLGQLPVKKRTAVALLILNEKYKKAGREHLPTVINLSRENIARFSGTTVESLVRVLRLFKDENIITAKGRRITIINPAELESMVR